MLDYFVNLQQLQLPWGFDRGTVTSLSATNSYKSIQSVIDSLIEVQNEKSLKSVINTVFVVFYCIALSFYLKYYFKCMDKV